MTPTLIVAAIFLAVLVGVYVGLVLPYYVTQFVMMRDQKKAIAALIPTPVNNEKLCKEKHVWIEAIGANDNGEYEPLPICKKCGFIPTKQLMSSEEGLKRVLLNNEMRDFELNVARDFEEKENEDIKNLFGDQIGKNGLTYDKINEIYRAGQTSNKRYTIYKIARSEELRRQPKDNA